MGGTATLLGLVAMAKDVEGLYAAVKALVCVVKSNRAAQQEMDRMKRYQVLLCIITYIGAIILVCTLTSNNDMCFLIQMR